jgi:protein-S-isoprenylcysteine O-methyltransferase Ste14
MRVDTVLHGLAIVVFLRFVVGAARIFSPDPGGRSMDLRAAPMAVSFWAAVALGYRHPAGPLWAIAAGVAAMVAAWLLFEWAARSIRGRRFSYAFSPDIPDFVHTSGPYAYVRNPFYASYLLALIGAAVIWPSRAAAAMAAAMWVYFVLLAQFEERKFAKSHVRDGYEAYKQRTGRLLPRLREIRRV